MAIGKAKQRARKQAPVVKTRASRWANRMAAQFATLASSRWHGVTPKSMALTNHCKQRNYGTNETYARVRRLLAHGLKLGFNWRDSLA